MPTKGQTKRRSANQPEDQRVKRTRVSRACDQCRVAREKCDGAQPTCSTCIGTRRRCSYTANPKKRGIQPGYIRTLELSLAYLFQQNPENETSLNDILAQGGPDSLLLSRDSKDSTKLHRRWRKTTFYTDVDKQLSGGEPSRNELPEQHFPSSSDEASEADAPVVTSMSRTHDQNGYTQADARSSGLQQLHVVDRHTDHLDLNDATDARMPKLRAGPTIEWPQFTAHSRTQPLESSIVPYQHHATGMQMSTPDPLSSMFPDIQLADPLSASALETFPEPHSTTVSLLTTSEPSQNDPRYPQVISDFEGFFDELASLECATRPDNQPQFMQNLGFGPEASMAELFSEYIPMQSSASSTSDDTAPVNFGQYGFNDTSCAQEIPGDRPLFH
jgi:hypothetical protein